MDEVYDALRSGHFVEENGSPLKLQHPLRAAYLARQGKAYESRGFSRSNFSLESACKSEALERNLLFLSQSTDALIYTEYSLVNWC
jgi:hypothetical protein